MKKQNHILDLTHWSVVGVTLVLFVAALFVKGMTHDILLETAVFLVSFKIILTTFQIRVSSNKIEKKIDALMDELKKAHPEK